MSSEEPVPSLKHLCNKAECAMINIPGLLSAPLTLAPHLSPNWDVQTMLPPPRAPTALGSGSHWSTWDCQQVLYFKIKINQNQQQQKLFPAAFFKQLPLWNLFSVLSLACPALLFLAQRRHNNGLGTCRSSCTSAFARGKILETFSSAQEHFGTKKPSLQIYSPGPQFCNRSIKKEHFSLLTIIAEGHLTPLVGNKAPFFPSFPAVTVFYRATKTMGRKAGKVLVIILHSLAHFSAVELCNRGICPRVSAFLLPCVTVCTLHSMPSETKRALTVGGIWAAVSRVKSSVQGAVLCSRKC